MYVAASDLSQVSPYIRWWANADLPLWSRITLKLQVPFDFLERKAFEEGSTGIPSFQVESEDD